MAGRERRRGSRGLIGLGLVALLTIPLVAYTATITLPHTFVTLQRL